MLGFATSVSCFPLGFSISSHRLRRGAMIGAMADHSDRRQTLVAYCYLMGSWRGKTKWKVGRRFRFHVRDTPHNQGQSKFHLRAQPRPVGGPPAC